MCPKFFTPAFSTMILVAPSRTIGCSDYLFCVSFIYLEVFFFWCEFSLFGSLFFIYRSPIPFFIGMSFLYLEIFFIVYPFLFCSWVFFIWKFFLIVGPFISENNLGINTYIGHMTNRFSCRLTYHLSDTNAITQHLITKHYNDTEKLT